MKRFAAGILGLALLLAGQLAARQPEPPKMIYDELFSFPPKIKLDEKQQASLAELRKSLEPRLVEYYKAASAENTSKGRTTGAAGATWRRFLRAATRDKIALLTDEQKQALGVVIIPSYAQKKALTDPNVWDVEQLEKVYDIQSRSYDPQEDTISFMVVTKKPWTEQERKNDERYWFPGGDPSTNLGDRVQAIFYDKSEVIIYKLLSGPQLGPAGPFPSISRAAAKLTDKQAEAGLLRFRIKIDLTLAWDGVKDAATVKIVYPQPNADKDK